MEETVSSYLRELDIPISRQYAEKLIASHPEYPSMLSIADALSRLGIDHQIIRVPLKELGKVPFPYLLKIERKRGWKLRVIGGQEDLEVAVPEKPGNTTAIVVRAEPTEEIDDPQNESQCTEESFRKVAIGGLLTALTGIFLLLNIPSMTWMHGLLFISAMGGAVIGYLLVAKDLGITYEPVQRFCHSGGATDACDRILNSGGTRIIEHFSLSDATASYFLFQLILLGLIIPLSTAGSPYYMALSVISALTLAMIAYSIYYQALKVQTWCPLCLGVDGVLAGQLGLFGYMYATGMVTIGVFSLSALMVTGL